MKTKITATVSGESVAVTIEAPDSIKTQIRNTVLSLLGTNMASLTAVEVKEIA